MPSTAHELLKDGTAALHRATEDRLNVRGLMAGTAGPEIYQRLLITHHTVTHGFLRTPQPVKANSLSPYTGLIGSFAEGLDLDLKATGFSAVAPDSPNTDPSWEKSAGALYVLLGASRGARMILPRLKKLPLLSATPAFNYFERAASVSEEQWKAFILLLDEQLRGKSERLKTLESAQNTFRSFIRVHTLLESGPNSSVQTVND